MTDHGQQHDDQTLRAAQETAVRDVLERLTTIPGLQRQVLAGEVVDAVLNAGGLCGEVSESPLLNRPPMVCAMPAGHTGRWHGDDQGCRWAPHGNQGAADGPTHPDLPTPPRSGAERAGQPLTRAAEAEGSPFEGLADVLRPHMPALGAAVTRALEALGEDADGQYLTPAEQRAIRDQAEARGYAAAVAELRGVVQRTGSPAARWAADYLEAVGPGADETVRACGGVVQGAPPIEEIGPPGFVWPDVRVVEGLPKDRIVFVSPRTDECAKGCDHVHAIAYDAGTGPLSATQSAQDGSGVGRGSGEGGTGGSGTP